jgi:hypothetical protein
VSIEPATFSHRARMPEFAAMNSAAAAERPSPASEGVEDPFGSLRQDADARSAERRWVDILNSAGFQSPQQVARVIACLAATADHIAYQGDVEELVNNWRQ